VTQRKQPQSTGTAARRLAWDVLRGVDTRGAYANLLLPALLRESDLDGRDRAFATELTYGTLRMLGMLDALLARGSSRPLDDVDPPVRDALRLGAYQLLATRVPPRAAVATTVELVRQTSGERPVRFTNAVLRRAADTVARAGGDLAVALDAPEYETDPIGHLSVVTAHPRWIVEAFSDALGGDLEELSAALRADDARPVTHLVARPRRIAATDLLAAARKLDEAASAGPWSPYAIRLTGGDPARLAAVRGRDAGVQDEGSQLVALGLAGAPGPDVERWVDLCAGPGGKTAVLAGLLPGSGLAVELHETRARLIVTTLDGDGPLVVVADGRQPPVAPSSVDRILLDAPCTGLGALRRRPEARWRRTAADVAPLARLQTELLESAIGLLRPGGVVAYATCSPHPAETDAVVAAALAAGAVEQVDIRPALSASGVLGDVAALAPDGRLRLWPHRHGTDAMFCTLLRKVTAP
jgi:16S rRNA (cytosine967-C5)-methyltransferase